MLRLLSLFPKESLVEYTLFSLVAEVLLTKITPLKEKVEVIEGGDAMEE